MKFQNELHHKKYHNWFDGPKKNLLWPWYLGNHGYANRCGNQKISDKQDSFFHDDTFYNVHYTPGLKQLKFNQSMNRKRESELFKRMKTFGSERIIPFHIIPDQVDVVSVYSRSFVVLFQKVESLVALDR